MPNPSNILSMIEEEAAPAEVAGIYAEIKQRLQAPTVPNMFKTLAVSPAALHIHWDLVSSVYRHSTLPHSLLFMILYTVAKTGNCTYCSAGNELNCRMLGIDEDTLEALVKDLGNVSPRRVRAIIEFCLKVAHHPQGMVSEDYERLRAEGISDAEMVELTYVAAAGVLSDTLADALKIEVEAEVKQALGDKRLKAEG